MPKSFETEVFHTIQDHGMVEKGDRVLAGVSGGPDSMALIRVLMDLCARLGITLGIAHLNHGLRQGTADRDQAFVSAFAAVHGIPFYTKSCDIKAVAKSERISIEEAGRNARYDFFNRICREKGYTRIALGHHRDDHVEQVLMNLIRGTGTQGLKGIPPVRQYHIIRPLIQVSKPEIESYLRALDQDWVIDETNVDPGFLRNRIRNRLIPFLEEAFNPEIRSSLGRLSQIATQEDDLLAGLAADAFQQAARRQGDSELRLTLSVLTGIHPALANRVIRQALGKVKGDLKRISLTHIQDILTLVKTAQSGKNLDLPGRIRVYKKGKFLYIRKELLPLRELGRIQKQQKKISRPDLRPKT